MTCQYQKIAKMRKFLIVFSYHLYVLQLDINQSKINQKQIFEKLRSAGFFVNLHYIPVYKHPYYKNNGHKHTYLKNAENYYSRAISIPIYPGISSDDQDRFIETLRKPFGHQSLF